LSARELPSPGSRSGETEFADLRAACDALPEVRKRHLEGLVVERGGGLADRLLAIGRECAAHLKEPFRSIEHGDSLYDERGLPH
jgi:hypothetical protein